MQRLIARRPSPALVLAGIAVFASLGGTGYAASKLTSGAGRHAVAAKAAKPVTKKQVNALIAAYVKRHRASLQGPAGNPGAQGIQGIAGANGHDGAAGPGATHIRMTTSSASGGAQPLATVGPWTFTLTCSGSGPNNLVTLTGPGTIAATTAIASGSSAGQSFVSPITSIGGGWTVGVNTGAQLNQTMLLQSGSTYAEVRLHLTASTGGLFVNCEAIGVAIPVS